MWYNGLLLTLLKSPLHFILSGSILVLRVTGRKTGTRIELPVNYTPDPGNPQRLLITSQPDRTWWRNLRGGAAVTLRLRGVDVPARAEVIEDPPQVSSSLQQYLKAAPEYARYLNVQIDSAGNPKPEDLDRLMNERVVVLSLLK